MAGGDRSNADAALVAALATGSTVKDAAKGARVSERTAYRRLEEEEFRRQVADARRLLVRQATGKLVEAMTQAADTLAALARSAESESVRLGAARAVVELAVYLEESETFEERLRALEIALVARGGNGR